MAKNKIILCDSNIMIKFMRGEDAVRQALHKIEQTNVVLSIITHAEVYRGTKRRKLIATKRILNQFAVYYLDKDTSKIFNGLIISYGHRYGLDIPDGLIAVTAISKGVPLFTYNKKDFDFIPELNLFHP